MSYVNTECKFHSTTECFAKIQFSLQGETPFFLGFSTSVATKLMNDFEIKEAFIDSTFNTNKQKFNKNKQKLELFSLMRKVLGKGIPLA